MSARAWWRGASSIIPPREVLEPAAQVIGFALACVAIYGWVWALMGQ